MYRKLALSAVAAAGLLLVTACSGGAAPTESSNVPQTMEDGVLTVAVPFFPYAGYAEGTDVTNPTGGFYTELAQTLAEDMDLEIKFVPIDWTAMIGGQATGYDITATAITKLPEREEMFDMTVTVDSDYLGLMTADGTPASTADDIRNMVIAACGACDSSVLITDVIKPTQTPLALDQDLEKYQALQLGRADAAMGDLSAILARSTEEEFDGFSAACRMPDPIEHGWVLAKGSPLFDQVNGLLQGYLDDGTIDELYTKWVVPTLGGVDPADVPFCPEFD